MSEPTLNARFQAHLRTPSPDPDAGLRGLGHYEKRLPKWRYRLRQWLIPIVRWETPYLARMQQALRSPLLDSYFAITANLGTHTFFMTALPICFWCGYADLGIALVHMLAAGVYLSGFMKDLVCLPRPLSPPLQRITMSGSAALEYGFPSTHTTNAVSVALFCFYNLWLAQDQYSLWNFRFLALACLSYATSISIGRMYCGMHGFLDVVFGAALGALITAARVLYGPSLDACIIAGGYTGIALAVTILALLVRFHPEPADNCPCFDDSVSFVGVVMGACIGTWHRARHLGGGRQTIVLLADMYPFSNNNPKNVAARLAGGIVLIFLWRAAMKPLLLTTLPPIFRSVDNYGLRIPRRYFLQSRDYNAVPPLRKDDKVLPPASEIPAMISSIRRRRRTISVGPQSEADAREHIANWRQQRREEDSSVQVDSKVCVDGPHAPLMPAGAANTTPDNSPGTGNQDSMEHVPMRSDAQHLSTPTVQVTAASDVLTPRDSGYSTPSDSGREGEKSEQKMFSTLEKPRIRYDVEVITKLVVYAGIAWLAVQGNPMLFIKLGIA